MGVCVPEAKAKRMGLSDAKVEQRVRTDIRDYRRMRSCGKLQSSSVSLASYFGSDDDADAIYQDKEFLTQVSWSGRPAAKSDR